MISQMFADTKVSHKTSIGMNDVMYEHIQSAILLRSFRNEAKYQR